MDIANRLEADLTFHIRGLKAGATFPTLVIFFSYLIFSAERELLLLQLLVMCLFNPHSKCLFISFIFHKLFLCLYGSTALWTVAAFQFLNPIQSR
jgi:hypothetical protein